MCLSWVEAVRLYGFPPILEPCRLGIELRERPLAMGACWPDSKEWGPFAPIHPTYGVRTCKAICTEDTLAQSYVTELSLYFLDTLKATLCAGGLDLALLALSRPLTLPRKRMLQLCRGNFHMCPDHSIFPLQAQLGKKSNIREGPCSHSAQFRIPPPLCLFGPRCGFARLFPR